MSGENTTQVDDLRARLNAKVQPKQASAIELPVQKARMFNLTVGQLRATCEANKDHPLAADKIESVKGMADHEEVICERIDIEAILDNKDVFIERRLQVIDGKDVTTVEKKLVDFKREEPNPAPAPAKVEPASVTEIAKPKSQPAVNVNKTV